MSAPLYDALCARAKRNTLRQHMPGHKGKLIAPLLSGAAEIDFTELDGTGNLYTGEGPIAEAELLAAAAYGADTCCFMTGGSSQGAHAALALCARPGETVLTDRNCHKSFFSGMALLDLNPVYFYNVSEIAEILEKNPEIKTVCLTSPTYYGVCTDIGAAAETCHAHGARLIVDEAHGAHFPFVGRGGCAQAHGADVSFVSAHKTLPALGSTAMLFASAAFSPSLVREKTALFGTSSPSYALMASIDWARDYLEGESGAEYLRAAESVNKLRREINARGVFRALTEADNLVLDPTRLTVNTAAGGLNGRLAAEILDRESGVCCEMSDRDNVVFILTCADTEQDFDRLEDALVALEEHSGAPKIRIFPAIPKAERRLSMRRAIFAPREKIPLSRSAGRILAAAVVPYPPGIPAAAPGEVMSDEIIKYLNDTDYDGESVDVVKENIFDE